MIAALLALIGLGAIAYGWITDTDPALLAGFLAFLIGLGLHELPVRRNVCAAPERLDARRAPTDPIDLSGVDWRWPDDRQRQERARERAA